MSLGSMQPRSLMLSQVASAMDVSSLQVPAGWSCEPKPVMPVQRNVSRDMNSNGTPRASPTACPYMQSLNVATITVSPILVVPVCIHGALRSGH